MNRLYKALESKYQAKIDEAMATLDIYFNKPVGVGEHPDIVDVLDQYLTMLDDYSGKLETLRGLFATTETAETAESVENS
jgi:hypothetical protein